MMPRPFSLASYDGMSVTLMEIGRGLGADGVQGAQQVFAQTLENIESLEKQKRQSMAMRLSLMKVKE